MNESYAEASVKKKQTIKDHLIRAGLITLIILLLLYGMPILGMFAVPVIK